MKLMEYLKGKTHPVVWQVTIAIIGGVVLLLGIVMIPYPGPGWLVVFLGLGILSTEFAWAREWLSYGRKKYDAWSKWALSQHWAVKTLLFLFTTVVVILTIWVLNGYGLINQWFNIGQDWLKSPFLW